MRRVKIVLAILVFIVLSVSFLTYRLGTVLTGLGKHLDGVEAAAGDPAALASACHDIEEYWLNHNTGLTRFVSQKNIDDLTAAVLLLEPMSRAEDKAMLDAEIKMLRLKIAEFWEAHSPSFSSFF